MNIVNMYVMIEVLVLNLRLILNPFFGGSLELSDTFKNSKIIKPLFFKKSKIICNAVLCLNLMTILSQL